MQLGMLQATVILLTIMDAHTHTHTPKTLWKCSFLTLKTIVHIKRLELLVITVARYESDHYRHRGNHEGMS